MLFKEGMITVPVSGRSLNQPDRILDVILQMSNTLSACRVEGEVLHNGLELVMDFFMLGTGRVYLVDQNKTRLDLAVAVGIDQTGLESMAMGEGFSGQAARNRCFLAQRVDDLNDPERVARLKSLGLRSVICLPLIAGDEVFGVMNLGARRILELNYRTIDGFTILGNMMAVAAKNARNSQELKETAALLAEQNQALRFFAYTASHDLKSPATAVHGLAERLRRLTAEKLSERELAIVEQMVRACGLLETLAGEINVYIQAKSGELEMEEVAVAEVLGELAEDVGDAMVARGVEWRDQTGNPKILAHRLSIRRILQNLVDNALKYGGERLKSITIGYQREEDRHVFWVKDDGAGLAQDEAENVFDLFHRGKNKSKTQAQGSGLGLAIVRELAKRHGGAAWADCRLREGCCFFFSLAADPAGA